VFLAIIPQACERDLPAGPHQSSSAGVSASGVTPHLAFATQLPASSEANVVISPLVRVVLQDSLGNTVPGATDTVTLALAANPNDAILLGTTTVAAIDGIATFADLRVDRPGSGYTLAATAARRTDVTSAPFVVRVTFGLGERRVRAHLRRERQPHGILLGRQRIRPAWRRGRDVPLVSAESGAGRGRASLHDAQRRGLAHLRRDHGRGGVLLGRQLLGQLGDGTTAGRTTPAAVAGGLRFAAVTAGSFHTCGLTTSGTAYCWVTIKMVSSETGPRTDARRRCPW